MSARHDAALDALASIPHIPLAAFPTPVEEMPRLRASLGPDAPRLLVKRDDAISFGFGGNKVRKAEVLASEARARGADTLLTVGGVQSNHCRVIAATAARTGMRCALIVSGQRPEPLTANALLDDLLGAEIHVVASRDDRAPAMAALADRMRGEGRRPFEIPLGASTPSGAVAFARAVAELVDQGPAPDFIVHSSSSGGTQAGLVAGCALLGLHTRVIGISADEPADSLAAIVTRLVTGIGTLLGVDGPALAHDCRVEVDDRFIGDGYGVPSAASIEAQRLAARDEALFVDHTYTAKALAGLMGLVREGRFRRTDTVLFWHTGGQVGLFAAPPAAGGEDQRK
jgi:1-aminocyclopropane-1-carboxylate deaminase/D-cysteine desulfhydrase-like pyridoxal-dependent ACC family enzyme